MPHSHGSHSDRWTNLASFGKIATTFVSFFFLGRSFDLATGLGENLIGLSYGGLVVGVALAACMSVAVAYGNRVLNTQNQTHSETALLPHNNRTPLICPPAMIAAPFFLSVTIEKAGPLTFVFELAGGNRLARWIRLLILGVNLSIGGMGAVAEARTIYHALSDSKGADNHESDFWTKSASVTEAVAGVITTSYWIACSIDLLSGVGTRLFGLSLAGFIIGLLIGCAAGASSAYQHYNMNLLYQGGHPVLPLEEEHTSLTWTQRFSLSGDLITHTGEYAAARTFPLEIAGAPKIAKIPVLIWGIFSGFLSSIGDVRAERNVMLRLSRTSTRSLTLN